MTRNFLTTTAMITALVAGSVAYAEGKPEGQGVAEPQASSSLQTNAETTAETSTYGPRVEGMPAYEEGHSKISRVQHDALASAVGHEFRSTDGEVIGVVSGVKFNENGESELHINTSDNDKIEADTVVITLSPEGIVEKDGKLVLDMTADEFYTSAVDNGTRGTERVFVISM
ncbi:MAG: hypothetical protein ACU0CQ_02555 [Sulfitobacter sp.]|jgi:hypothetical protein|uniref:hypothetical protein n=1 Tax=Sulfitobacter sp. TaxID=1903071 RepID=UPI000C3A96D7|nr:hypothetical protein [Roseobacter sp.]|tara:strand:+ start:1085 stop:1600 length:516 start_codon:yes stop_codon:yes gene_type:complete